MERQPLTPNGDGSVTETGNKEQAKQERSEKEKLTERDNNEETMYDACDGSDGGAASDGGSA